MSPDSGCINQGRILGEVIPEEKKENLERKGGRRWFSQVLLCRETPQRSSSSKVRRNCQISSEQCHHINFHSGSLPPTPPGAWGLHTWQRSRLRPLPLKHDQCGTGRGWTGLWATCSSGRYPCLTRDNGQERGWGWIWGILFGWILTFSCLIFPSKFPLYEILSLKPIKAIFHPQWTLEGCNNRVHDLGIHLTSALSSSVVDVEFIQDCLWFLFSLMSVSSHKFYTELWPEETGKLVIWEQMCSSYKKKLL